MINFNKNYKSLLDQTASIIYKKLKLSKHHKLKILMSLLTMIHFRIINKSDLKKKFFSLKNIL